MLCHGDLIETSYTASLVLLVILVTLSNFSHRKKFVPSQYRPSNIGYVTKRLSDTCVDGAQTTTRYVRLTRRTRGVV